MSHKQLWTARETRRVVECIDSDIVLAEQLGRTVRAIRIRRYEITGSTVNGGKVRTNSQDVAELLAQGMTDDAIGRRLGVSLRTVRRYVALYFASLGATSRFQAGVRAVSRGDIPPQNGEGPGSP